jgi:hypothetical protein
VGIGSKYFFGKAFRLLEGVFDLLTGKLPIAFPPLQPKVMS